MLALCLMLLVTYIVLKNNAGMIGSPIAAFETILRGDSQSDAGNYTYIYYYLERYNKRAYFVLLVSHFSGKN